jgi:hypothetical protein
MHELPLLEARGVLRSLRTPTADEVRPVERTRSARRWVVRVLALCCLVLVPWTIGLAVTLPQHYLVRNWPAAWIGFDVVLLGCLSTTAWALWKERQVAVPASLVTSVLLLCDAWFDLLTAHGGHCLMVSIAVALFAEVPLAILLGVISVRLLHASVRAAQRFDSDTPIQPLWRTPLINSARASATPWMSSRSGGGGSSV